MLTTTLKRGKFKWSDVGRPGGMPSGHATLAGSVTTLALLHDGFGSTVFVVSACFSFLFVYDAVKLRWETGKHAKVLNHLLGAKKLEERLGHTMIETFTGICLGVGVSFLLLSM